MASVRSAAARAAAQIRAQRLARIAERENAISERVGQFLEHTGRAEQIMATARRRCTAIMTEAQADAMAARARAAAAVRGLDDLGVPRGEIMEMTQVSARDLRALLAHDERADRETEPAGDQVAASDADRQGTAEQAHATQAACGLTSAREPGEKQDTSGSTENRASSGGGGELSDPAAGRGRHEPARVDEHAAKDAAERAPGAVEDRSQGDVSSLPA